MLGIAHNFESGILFLDKPSGLTSRRAARALLNQLGIPSKVKWGYVGILDPLASGLLPILIGSGTAAISFLEGIFSTKTYEATFVLGKNRIGDDATGDVISDTGCRPGLRRLKWIEQTIQQFPPYFLCTRYQRPPDFSAKWVDGQRAYHMARRGAQMSLPSCPVRIQRMEMRELHIDPVDRQVECCFEIVISKGGYIRSLSRDLGTDVGIGGYLARLQRTTMGSIVMKDLLWQGIANFRNVLVPFSHVFGELKSDEIQGHAHDILSGQKHILKISQPTESIKEIACTTVLWNNSSYRLFLKPLRHMPGHQYQVLKRTEISCRICPS